MRMSIISQGTGLAYPGEHTDSSPYTYYSMTTWVYYYLLGKTSEPKRADTDIQF
jgi:hypothetical protein